MFDIESILVDSLNESKKHNKTVVKSKENLFNNWPKSRNPSKYKSRALSEWSQRDFSFYMEKEYTNTTGEPWDLNLLGVTTYLSRVKAQLRDFYGFCDNILLKDYIDYFYAEWLSYCKNFNIKFWLNFMLNKKPLSAFCSSYAYQDRTAKTEAPPKTVDSNYSALEKDLDTFYSLSFEALIFNYGLVLSVNYLLGKHLLNEKKVYDKISQIIRSSTKNGSVVKIKEKTEKYNGHIGEISKEMIIKKLRDDYSIVVDI